MVESECDDRDVQDWLQTIGVASLCEWDVLAFMHGHQATLMPPHTFARLMGYRHETVAAALESLAAAQLLQLSPEAHGARLYQFCVPADPSRCEALERLLALSHHRRGRLLLSRNLRRGDRTPEEGLEAARRFLDDARRIVKIAQHRSREVRREIQLLRARGSERAGHGLR
jgi:hypothetical protein